MLFELESYPYTGEQDFTEIQFIKFADHITGDQKANFLAKVFADIYYKDAPEKRQRCKVATDYRFPLKEEVLSIRGYKKSVVCIISRYNATWGPECRIEAKNKNSFWEENNRNVFFFRQMLERVREYDKAVDDRKKQEELNTLQRDFELLSLKGDLIEGLGIPERKVHGTGYGVEIRNETEWEGISVWFDNYISRDQTMAFDEVYLRFPKALKLPRAEALSLINVLAEAYKLKEKPIEDNDSH